MRGAVPVGLAGASLRGMSARCFVAVAEPHAVWTGWSQDALATSLVVCSLQASTSICLRRARIEMSSCPLQCIVLIVDSAGILAKSELVLCCHFGYLGWRVILSNTS